MNFCRTLSALLVFGLVSLNQSAVTHSHGGQREKVVDGAFSPRDVHHHSADGKHDNAFDHEAILGSAKEAAEFDTLPAEDAKSRLKLLVGKISHMEGFQ
jgi:hypothetical protein